MRQAQETLIVTTKRQGNHDITRDIAAWVERQGMATGLLSVLLQHVSAHLALQEHADRDDLSTFFRRLEARRAEDFGEFTSAVTSLSLIIPIAQGRLGLGARQRIYIYEHRASPQNRSLLCHLMGE
jgi:secondary thiamine-phosphate synthase enzyme